MSIEVPFVNALQGSVVSSVWRGHGTAIFLEFGDLSFKSSTITGRNLQPQGAITLMIEWSWRIERPRSILGGSFSPETRWPAMFEKLIGAKVQNIQFLGALPEVVVWLSNGLRVSSFMTTDGQPAWSIICHKLKIGVLCVNRGHLHVEAKF
jgi:hypothetical protein